MVTQPVAVVRREHHQGVVCQAFVVQRRKDPPQVVVHQRNHPVVVRDQFAQLCVGLRGHARVFLAYLAVAPLRRVFQRGAMPPGTTIQIAGTVGRQVDVGWMVQITPGCGGVERMVRVGKGNPGAERLAVPLTACAATAAQVVHCAVTQPGAVVPGRRKGGVVRLRGVRGGRQPLTVESVLVVTQAISVVPALVMHATGCALRQPVVVAELDQFHMVETHVGPRPVVREQMRTLQVLAASGGQWRVVAGEVRLAEEGGGIPRPAEGTRKAAFRQGLVQIDAVVVAAVGQRQQAGQHRRARRHADHVRRDACRETRALRGEKVQVRCPHRPPFEPVAVAPVLVAGDQEDVGPGRLRLAGACHSSDL